MKLQEFRLCDNGGSVTNQDTCECINWFSLKLSLLFGKIGSTFPCHGRTQVFEGL